MKRPSPVTGLLFFLFSLAGLFLVSLLYTLLSSHLSLPDSLSYWFSTLSELAVYGLPVALFYGHRPESIDFLRWRRLSLRSCISLGLAAIAGVYFLNFVTLLWSMVLERFGLALSSSSIAIPQHFSGLVMLLISAAAAPAVCEEMLFRGLLLPSLEGRGRRYALFLSALLFALSHSEIAGLPSLFLLGLVMGALAIRTESLLSPIVYHFFHNGFILIVSYLSQDMASDSLTVSLSDLLSALPGFLLFGAVWLALLFSVFRSYPAPLPPLRAQVSWKYYLLLAIIIIAMLVMLFLNLLPLLEGGLA